MTAKALSAACLLLLAAGCGDEPPAPSAAPQGPVTFVWPARAVARANLSSGGGVTALGGEERLSACLSCEARLRGELSGAPDADRESAAKAAGFASLAEEREFLARLLRAFDILQRLRTVEKIEARTSERRDPAATAALGSAAAGIIAAAREECVEAGITVDDLLLLHNHSAELVRLLDSPPETGSK